MKDETAQIEQRIKRYWYTDGIGELLGGVVFLVLAVYFIAQQYFEGTAMGGLLQAAFILIVLGLLFFGRKLLNWLKARVTYPRTGYVEYRVSGKNAIRIRILSAFVAMAVAVTSIMIARRIQSIDSMVAITGVLVAVGVGDGHIAEELTARWIFRACSIIHSERCLESRTVSPFVIT